MVKKGFPKFGMSQAGAYVTALKNYNLPDFILKLVAKDTDSELLERGRIDDRLQSMNDDALELLNRIFVDCEEDKKGKYAQYRPRQHYQIGRASCRENMHSIDFLHMFLACIINVKF